MPLCEPRTPCTPAALWHLYVDAYLLGYIQQGESSNATVILYCSADLYLMVLLLPTNPWLANARNSDNLVEKKGSV